MKNNFSNRLETYVGIALLLVAVLGFLFMILTSLPNQTQVSQIAKPLKQIPRDLFSSQNDLNKMIQGLNTPNGVPVTVDPSTLGRTNVFENP